MMDRAVPLPKALRRLQPAQAADHAGHSGVLYVITVVAISIRSSKFRTGLFNDDRLAGQFKLRTVFFIFGTAVDSANSNFGWSFLGKPARLPGAVNSSSSAALAASAAALISSAPETAPCSRARRRASTAWPWRGPLLGSVAAGAGGGTAGPAGPPGSLIAVCVASVSGPCVRPGKSFAFWIFWHARSVQTRRGERAESPG
jgi:hypothetical protein